MKPLAVPRQSKVTEVGPTTVQWISSADPGGATESSTSAIGSDPSAQAEDTIPIMRQLATKRFMNTSRKIGDAESTLRAMRLIAAKLRVLMGASCPRGAP